jgi:hypothetical protein
MSRLLLGKMNGWIGLRRGYLFDYPGESAYVDLSSRASIMHVLDVFL